MAGGAMGRMYEPSRSAKALTARSAAPANRAALCMRYATNIAQWLRRGGVVEERADGGVAEGLLHHYHGFVEPLVQRAELFLMCGQVQGTGTDALDTFDGIHH